MYDVVVLNIMRCVLWFIGACVPQWGSTTLWDIVN